MNAAGNTILITGGGSGIGRELAARFHALRNTVIVAGRRKEALQQTIAGRDGMLAVTLDMEDPEAIAACARQLLADHPSLNVLINNAGIMHREDLTRTRDLHNAEKTLATNLLGPIRLTNALIDHLARRPDSTVINVTSGLAFVPLSGTPTYCASKAALHSYTLSLREQLKGKVEVIELVPPGVRTELEPGQSSREGFMVLDEFIEEAMALFGEKPTPAEILVQQVGFLRRAEREGHFDQAIEILNAH